MATWLRQILAISPALAAMVGIFMISNISGTNLDLPFQVKDKIMHFGAYGLLCALWVLGLHWGWRSTIGKAAIIGAVISGLYGITDEIHQSFVPGRSPEVLDAVADALGAICMSGILFVMFKPTMKKTRS